jgi:Leucine-rich repeat (LRR) protein
MQTEPPNAEPPKRKRRWFQFSLRSLMMLTLLVGLGMATWIVPIKNRAERQKAAVEAIKNDSGSLFYDYELDAYGNGITGAEPPGPAWLRRLLGDDFFTTVVGVGVNTPADMKYLGELSELRGVGAYGVPIADVDLESIRGSTQLKGLNLSLTKVTDAGLRNLKTLSQLEDLELSVTRVTDLGLKHLRGLTKLKSLNLNDTRITDAGLESLSGLSRLQALTLSHTKLTDAGLDRLKGLTKLRELHLEGTNVTGAGVKDLQKALPNCTISFGPTKR